MGTMFLVLFLFFFCLFSDKLRVIFSENPLDRCMQLYVSAALSNSAWLHNNKEVLELIATGICLIMVVGGFKGRYVMV